MDVDEFLYDLDGRRELGPAVVSGLQHSTAGPAKRVVSAYSVSQDCRVKQYHRSR